MGVNAPGRPTIMTFRPPQYSAMLIFRGSGKPQKTVSAGSLSPGLIGVANAVKVEVNGAAEVGAILADSADPAARRDERNLILMDYVVMVQSAGPMGLLQAVK